MFALDPKALSMLGILHQQNQRACKAADSTPATGQCWKWCKQFARPSKQGSQAGNNTRLKAKPHRPAIPSILLSNSRFNKIDYLRLDLITQQKVRLQHHYPHWDMA